MVFVIFTIIGALIVATRWPDRVFHPFDFVIIPALILMDFIFLGLEGGVEMMAWGLVIIVPIIIGPLQILGYFLTKFIYSRLFYRRAIVASKDDNSHV
jgi:hypothetical protein